MNQQITRLNTKRNILAFSGGVDSSALFFLLLENDIEFDIAIVDYNIRTQSKDEVFYAKLLARKYNKRIFLKEVEIKNSSNFEKKARDIRYAFFDAIIKENDYETLITAHQLNDKLEWFLMQLSRGAGLSELISFEEFSIRKNYSIFKPLINISKNEILEFLQANKIKYFIDSSNTDEKYKRNYFRKNFSNDFLEEFKTGIKKSFTYLRKDLNSLNINQKPIFTEQELEIYKITSDDNINIRIIDKSLKIRGILLSKSQRDEIIKQKELVVSHKISVNLTKEFIFISPYKKDTMPKQFKEKCRINKIPKNIRSYIFINNLFKNVSEYLENI
jgi:tRNA(Ile)-lysidine synthase